MIWESSSSFVLVLVLDCGEESRTRTKDEHEPEAKTSTMTNYAECRVSNAGRDAAPPGSAQFRTPHSALQTPHCP